MHERVGVLAAELPEQAGVNQELAEGRGHESAENHGGDGIQDFSPRFLAAEHEWHEADAGGQSAVISTGASRSKLPRTTISGVKASPSSFIKWK